MAANAIYVQLAIKRSQRALIACIIVVMWVQNKYDKSCKHEREGSSLRGISRTTRLAYNTVVSIVRSASQKAQLVHNAEVQAVRTQEVSLDELWSFVEKNRNSATLKNQRLETARLDWV